MGLVDYGIPQRLALAARDRFGVHHFVETGTFKGDTTAWAADHFARVFTVELDPQRLAQAQNRFRHHPKIQCVGGSSGPALAGIIAQLQKAPALFFLDAHWMGDSSASHDECPVEAELAAINASGLDAYIIVDDARLFLAPPPRPHNADAWPLLDRLIPQLVLGRRYCVIVDDVIIAWPAHAREFLVEYSRTRPRAWTAPTGIFLIPQSQLPPRTINS